MFSEDKIIVPLEAVLTEVIPKTPQVQRQIKNKNSLRKSLDELFPEQQYDDKDLQKAKDALGLLANEFSIIELKEIVAEINFLVSSWLDDYERKVFNGLTLNELLHEKGGL